MVHLVESRMNPERFAAYVEELREFYASRRMRFGRPEDLAAAAGILEGGGAFGSELLSMVRSVMYREHGGLGTEELLALVAVSLGGPEVEQEGERLQEPMARVAAFLLKGTRGAGSFSRSAAGGVASAPEARATENAAGSAGGAGLEAGAGLAAGQGLAGGAGLEAGAGLTAGLGLAAGQGLAEEAVVRLRRPGSALAEAWMGRKVEERAPAMERSDAPTGQSLEVLGPEGLAAYAAAGLEKPAAEDVEMPGGEGLAERAAEDADERAAEGLAEAEREAGAGSGDAAGPVGEGGIEGEDASGELRRLEVESAEVRRYVALMQRVGSGQAGGAATVAPVEVGERGGESPWEAGSELQRELRRYAEQRAETAAAYREVKAMRLQSQRRVWGGGLVVAALLAGGAIWWSEHPPARPGQEQAAPCVSGNERSQ